MNQHRFFKFAVWALFVIYMAALLKLAVFRGDFATHPLLSGEIRLSLFGDYAKMLAKGQWGLFVYLFFGNIGWFFPFGLLTPLLRRIAPSFLWTVLHGLLLSLIVESMQYIFGTGISEADDLLLNTLGAALGYLTYGLIVKKRGQVAHRIKASNK